MTDNDDQQSDSSTIETTGPLQQQWMIARRYALLDELGRGGMGVVWRAEDRMIRRSVAVKELRGPDDAEQAAVFQERVLREVRTGGRVNDPAVVTVYDVVTEDAVTYIVMELVEAPTLSDVVRQRGPLPTAEVAHIGDQVLSALQAAHDAGIVHRDVKPGNIMVAANGRVKLTDFGIAQAVDDPRLTTSGNLVGSPAFMSPERVAGSDAVPASDLWSLGAALFYAVEGVVAFERTSTAATLHAIMNEVPYLTQAQGPLASAIMGLLISSPDARLSSQQARGLLVMASSRVGQVGPADGQLAPTAMYPGQAPTMASGQTPRARQDQSSGAGRTRRGWMLAGAALTAVGLLVGGLFIGKGVFGPGSDEQMAPTLTYGQNGDVPELNYASGYSSDYCVNAQIQPGAKLRDSNWGDCEGLHVAEVYQTGSTYGGSDSDGAEQAHYPKPDGLRNLAETHCSLVFHSNRITGSERGRLEYRALIPSSAEWQKQPGSSTDDPTREYYCVAFARDNSPLRNTVRNDVR